MAVTKAAFQSSRVPFREEADGQAPVLHVEQIFTDFLEIRVNNLAFRVARKVKPEDLTIVEPMNVKPKMIGERAELVAKMELQETWAPSFWRMYDEH